MASPAASSQNLSSPRMSQQSSVASSAVFVINALEKVAAAREARRNKPLKEAVDTALKMLKNNEPVPEGQTRSSVILTALQSAIDTRSANLMTISLDCLGKFITYNYVADMEDEVAQTQVMEKVVDGICDCFIGEETDKKVQLQIIKALLDAVYSTSNPLHLSALLKAVRTTYNIFLLSRNNDNQNVAQITMTQMVDHIFRRVKTNPNHITAVVQEAAVVEDKAEASNTTLKNDTDEENKEESTEENAESSTAANAPAVNNAPIESEADSATYQQQIIVEANMARTEMDHKLPSGKSKDNYEDFLNDTANVFQEEKGSETLTVNHQALTTVPTNETTGTADDRGSFDNDGMQNGESETEADLYIKDAILVFRALCKLSKKSIQSEWGNDMRSYSMRSKLLSLHLILTIMMSHIDVFTSDQVFFSAAVADPRGHRANPFILEVKQYLCPSIGRNAFSVVPQVFDITHEILWRVVQGLRVYLKNEIEIFLKEIVLRILEMRSASNQQKFSLLKGVLRICEDPQTLVDVYLNYDCDREALDNIYERLVNVLSKITTSHHQTSNSKDHDNTSDPFSSSHATGNQNHSSMFIPPPLTTATILHSDKQNQTLAMPESAIRFKSLECLVAVLRSLVGWYQYNSVSITAGGEKVDEDTPRASEDQYTNGQITNHSNTSVSRLNSANGSSTQLNGNNSRMDDPEEFENLKHRKQMLQEGIRQFNWKAKKGLAALESNGFLDLKDHKSVAKFLLNTEGLNKTTIGEFLGEGEAENIAIMHAFVDEMDFSNMKFTEALRAFLQAFRLPGESQKIDRYMLKFAERYVHGNPDAFANAETAYVLAFSVIMLNTDLHSPNVKRRMTLDDFIRNNRGIDDGQDIPREVLEANFNEIATNEIKMNDEVEAANEASLIATPGAAGALGMSGLQNALVNAGITRDVRREAYQAATEEMGSKTEAMFRNMLASRRRAGENETITFYSASHVEHVRPMFEVAWMAFLAGISGPLQESDDLATVNLCLDGFKNAIRIICLFHTVQSEDVDLQRDAFVTTLTKFTFLTNLNEMKPKNVEAIKTLLEVAAVDGNYLKGSWKEILSTVSQLERFQLVTSGMDGGSGGINELPNGSATVKRAPAVKASMDFGRRTSVMGGRNNNGRNSGSSRTNTQLSLTEEVTSASSSQSLVLAVDRLFTSTVNLNGSAVVDFVRALCETSWEEIISSAHMEHPRMYSLQKLVEISYYNMNRIRMEWSNIWAILGDYFNKVGCQSNFNVAFFALDSLRQLAMKFLEKEELPHFKFQKDFLMPFREVLANNPDVAIKDMVLRCLSQMIQARPHHLRSGWKTMLSVFATGACESSESIVHMTFDIVRSVTNERFGDIVANGTFPDYISCLVEFSKNHKFQKISLPALDMIKGTIPKMLEISNKSTPLEITDAHATNASNAPVQAAGDDFLVKFWFAVLYGLKEVVMQSDDVEVRKRALVYLFETLKKYGDTFTPEFWTTVSRQIVFPLFDDLNNNNSTRRKMSPEDLSVWLSTTMIEALRNVVDLYTFYFDNMRDMMVHVLHLFSTCITQDNDTLAPIGCECLDQYIEANVEKFDNNCWDLVTETFTDLFENTTANGLFDDTEDLVEKVKSMSAADSGSQSLESRDSLSLDISEERQRNFQQVIIKCVLQLMLIQTVNDLLAKDNVYCAYPAPHLMTLMDCLGRSFHFAKKFNIDNDLRMALFRFGFMKQLPNLLKQETSSGGCYVSVLMRMYANLENINDRDDKREEIEKILIPLCNEIFTLYAELDHETKPKNIAAWTPVVVNILNGLAQLQDEDFLRHVPRFYLPSVELLGQESLLPEIRMALRTLLTRVGTAYNITKVAAQEAAVNEN